MNHKTRARLVLVGIFALFMLPILTAYMLNLQGLRWMPFGTANHGELLQPPRLLETAGLRAIDGGHMTARSLAGVWTLLTVADLPCRATCMWTLDSLARVRLALGKDMQRVQRLYVTRGAPHAQDVQAVLERFPGLRIAIADARFLAQLPRVAPGVVLLVDPRRYLILRYHGPAAGQGLLKDLQRLLRISRIG